MVWGRRGTRRTARKRRRGVSDTCQHNVLKMFEQNHAPVRAYGKPRRAWAKRTARARRGKTTCQRLPRTRCALKKRATSAAARGAEKI